MNSKQPRDILSAGRSDITGPIEKDALNATLSIIGNRAHRGETTCLVARAG
jgi:hypothetical protein